MTRPRIVSKRRDRDGYIKVDVVTLQGPDGETIRREVEDHGRSACVLPYDPARKVAMLVSMARTPLLLAGEADDLLEAPAGMLDAGESAEAAVRREAMEETGLALTAVEPVAVVWPSPGVSAETSALFLAPYGQSDRVGEGGGLASEHEGITVREVPLGELRRLAEGGALRDLKTLALVLALIARRPELF
ncbi:MAG TPA: NUDIX hydrolase [Caulobacteraceae bacterium]|nr:NUDIX hydrolase [Caulobacteraceae bacterium]